MKTHILDFLKQYEKSNYTRLHMPGHKGRLNELNNIDARLDITEIDGADNLYNSNGIIEQSEKNLSNIYGSKFSVFSTGGSTLSIQTMLYSVFQKQKTKKIIAFRNVHLAFINSCSLLGINPVWVYPKYTNGDYVSGSFCLDDLEKTILQNKDSGAIYVTSPDYLGYLCDIKGIVKLGDKYNIPVLVDNAHGAHLKFLKQNVHPIELGATMCCDSAHKTLPALTGASFLHIGRGEYDKAQIKDNMRLFGSTSPSYLILASIDICIKYLYQSGELEYQRLEKNLNELKDICKQKGFVFLDLPQDNVKITLNSFDIGYNGDELANHFRKFNIEPEYVGNGVIVFLFSPLNQKDDLEVFKNAVLKIKVKNKVKYNQCYPQISTVRLTPQQCLFSDYEIVKIDDSVGRICGENKILCPPGVPIIMMGEVICDVNKNLLKSTGIVDIKVLK